ncbi:hypothetical protein GCM10018980_51310 [Streptomyces capoamus]|uniref:Transposase n=1 Tax=Streptomyces capoamus TaxID=68183 RepID=A0A919KE21_9ACTN|nr:hypothetical protein [Streptomyces capoamus]GGW15836.1 hypothetical protein GCM10010501_29500 [Streptomyces libani subsp. rufus]GHG61838.1 hypothetical protein GCM10018980_51310 [Streptomyces capoamus]
MTARVLVGGLFVDCGDGFENKNGDRAGQITYRRAPRARYECLRCQTVEGPVSGAAAVKRFVATIRTIHVCRTGAQPLAA